MTGGGGAPRIFSSAAAAAWLYGRRGGVRPDERALKQHTHWTGVFSGFTGKTVFLCHYYFHIAISDQNR